MLEIVKNNACTAQLDEVGSGALERLTTCILHYCKAIRREFLCHFTCHISTQVYLDFLFIFKHSQTTIHCLSWWDPWAKCHHCCNHLVNDQPRVLEDTTVLYFIVGKYNVIKYRILVWGISIYNTSKYRIFSFQENRHVSAHLRI